MAEPIGNFFQKLNQYKTTGLLVPVICGFVILSASVNLQNFETETGSSSNIVNTTSSPLFEQSNNKLTNQTTPVLSGESISWGSTGKVLP